MSYNDTTSTTYFQNSVSFSGWEKYDTKRSHKNMRDIDSD